MGRAIAVALCCALSGALAAPPAADVDALETRLRAFEAQDPQRRLTAELGTLRAWIDALRTADAEQTERLRARIDAQSRLVEALLARNAVEGQLRPMREQTYQLRGKADKLAREIQLAEERLATYSRTPRDRRPR